MMMIVHLCLHLQRKNSLFFTPMAHPMKKNKYTNMHIMPKRMHLGTWHTTLIIMVFGMWRLVVCCMGYNILEEPAASPSGHNNLFSCKIWLKKDVMSECVVKQEHNVVCFIISCSKVSTKQPLHTAASCNSSELIKWQLFTVCTNDQ